MPDWTSSMQQTFEYYTVDPGTWEDVDRITTVTSSSIVRDSDTDTLSSATLEMNESIGEKYVRIYLVTIQNGVTEKFSLGTFLVQTPSTTYNGKFESTSVEAYSPLLELKETQPALGYSLLKGESIMQRAYMLTREHARAPVVLPSKTESLAHDFISNTDDTWLTFLQDLMGNAKFKYDLDDRSRILFAPIQDTAALQPVWTFDDSNSSILYPEVSMDRDIYGIPNVVEVVYSNGGGHMYSRAVNNDVGSPISTVNRGREIVYRVIDPEITSFPTEKQLDEYADRLLRNLSTLECTIKYKHGYCPVRVGDCVMLNYERANMINIKAKVTRQSIECEPGCPVTETAVFTNKLWR